MKRKQRSARGRLAKTHSILRQGSCHTELLEVSPQCWYLLHQFSICIEKCQIHNRCGCNCFIIIQRNTNEMQMTPFIKQKKYNLHKVCANGLEIKCVGSLASWNGLICFYCTVKWFLPTSVFSTLSGRKF